MDWINGSNLLSVYVNVNKYISYLINNKNIYLKYKQTNKQINKL